MSRKEFIREFVLRLGGDGQMWYPGESMIDYAKTVADEMEKQKVAEWVVELPRVPNSRG